MMLSSISPVNISSGLATPSLQTQVLAVEDIRAIVQRVGLNVLMDEMITRLTAALKCFDPQTTVVPVRSGFNYQHPHVGLVEWMPLFQKYQQIVVKAVGYHPENPQRHNLPTVLSTLSAYDPASGHLTAIMDGTFLTALRTGAASAVASQCLALPASQTLGIIGAGAQAVTQLHALARCFDLKQVLVFDCDPAASDSFAERVACLHLDGIDIRLVDAATAVANADILCTATSVAVDHGPVFVDRDSKPWLHVNAVGADFPGKFEVPLSLLQRSFVCPDFHQQALQEGECQQLQATDAIGPELHQVVQSPEPHHAWQQQQTVFDSTGFALEDQVAMNLLLDYATDLQMGTWISLESAYAEVKNPYSFVTDAVMTGDRPNFLGCVR